MYVPGNVVVAAAGQLDHNELLRLLARAESKAHGPPARGRRVRRPWSRRRRRACASRGRTPSSTTSASPRPASRAPTAGASPRLSWTRSSAGRRRPASSRRSARSGGWPTPSTASPRSTPTPATSASTSARARRTSRPWLEIAGEQLAEVAAGNLRPDELARAKENLKGRIMLSMESTSNRMSRLGKSLITDTELLSFDRIIAEIDAVEPEALAELAGLLLAPEKLSTSGIGPSEELFLAAVERVNPALTPPRREFRPQRTGRQGRPRPRSGARRGRARARRARRRPRR